MSVTLQWARERGWPRTVLAVLPFAAVLTWIYLPVVRGMAGQWYRNPNYSHGFLIPLVSGYALWTRRLELRGAASRPSVLGLVPLLAGLSMYILGSVGAAHTTLRLSLIVVVGGAVLFVCGRKIFGIALHPMLYLLFMVPLPAYLYDAVAFPLKLVVARFSVAVMQALEMTVYREGSMIVFPNAVLEIADACSGIRSLYTLVAFAVAFSLFFIRQGWRKVVLFIPSGAKMFFST